jgi:hypothetical protein
MVSNLDGEPVRGATLEVVALSVVGAPPEATDTDDAGEATIVLRPVIKACGGLVIWPLTTGSCTEIPDGLTGSPVSFTVRIKDTAEVLQVDLLTGQVASGEALQLTVVEISAPMPDSPPEEFFPDFPSHQADH